MFNDDEPKSLRASQSYKGAELKFAKSPDSTPFVDPGFESNFASLLPGKITQK